MQLFFFFRFLLVTNLVIFVVLPVSVSFGAEVVNTFGNRAYVSIVRGERLKIGQIYNILGRDTGNHVAQVKIEKFLGNSVEVLVVEGLISQGDSIVPDEVEISEIFKDTDQSFNYEKINQFDLSRHRILISLRTVLGSERNLAYEYRLTNNISIGGVFEYQQFVDEDPVDNISAGYRLTHQGFGIAVNYGQYGAFKRGFYGRAALFSGSHDFELTGSESSYSFVYSGGNFVEVSTYLRVHLGYQFRLDAFTIEVFGRWSASDLKVDESLQEYFQNTESFFKTSQIFGVNVGFTL